MSKPFLKKKSKKLTTKTRCKIEKKVREHHRKVRKQLKKQGGKKGSKKQEIVVPSKAPFKEEILKQAQKVKEEKEEQRIKKKEKIKKLKDAVKQQLKNKGRNTDEMEKLVREAQTKQSVFEAKKSLAELAVPACDDMYKPTVASDGSMKAYYSEVKKVLEAADVVIEVIDARDPLGSRCRQLEAAVLAANKRLVLLLNKIDLIPKSTIDDWLKYLRKEFPTIAFKASTQEQASNLGTGARDASSTSKCVGADLLMKLLGNYCRNKDIKTRILVGVVGFPNVGKSSVINSLKRTKCCHVGATPGITKKVQEVELDKKIRLIDSPGVVMANKTSGDHIEVALKNAVKIESLPDPITPVDGIMRKVTRESMMLQYNIPEFADTVEFLAHMAFRLGKVKKGGVPDYTAAARQILYDWNTGKIRYYTEPPENEPTSSGETDFAIVEEMSKEFELDKIDECQKALVDSLPNTPKAISALVPASAISDGLVIPEPGTMETDQQDGPTVKVDPRVSSKPLTEAAEKMDPEMMIEGNQQFGKKRKATLKKNLKRRKRSDKIASKLSDSMNKAMETFMDTENKYDFADAI